MAVSEPEAGERLNFDPQNQLPRPVQPFDLVTNDQGAIGCKCSLIRDWTGHWGTLTELVSVTQLCFINYLCLEQSLGSSWPSPSAAY